MPLSEFPTFFATGEPTDLMQQSLRFCLNSLSPQISRDLKARPRLRLRYGGKLGEGDLEVFYYLSGDDFGGGKVGAVFEGFVFEPDAIEDCPGLWHFRSCRDWSF